MTRPAGRHSRPSLLASVAASAVRAARFVAAIRITTAPAVPAEARGDDFTSPSGDVPPLVPFPMAADNLPPVTSYRYPYDAPRGPA